LEPAKVFPANIYWSSSPGAHLKPITRSRSSSIAMAVSSRRNSRAFRSPLVSPRSSSPQLDRALLSSQVKSVMGEDSRKNQNQGNDGIVMQEFRAWIADGVILCKLLNVIQPGIVPTIYTASAGERLSTFRSRENIHFFIKGVEAMGIFKRFQGLFSVNDLIEGKNMSRVVDTLTSLGKALSRDEKFSPQWQSITTDDVTNKKDQVMEAEDITFAEPEDRVKRVESLWRTAFLSPAENSENVLVDKTVSTETSGTTCTQEESMTDGVITINEFSEEDSLNGSVEDSKENSRDWNDLIHQLDLESTTTLDATGGKFLENSVEDQSINDLNEISDPLGKFQESSEAKMNGLRIQKEEAEARAIEAEKWREDIQGKCIQLEEDIGKIRNMAEETQRVLNVQIDALKEERDETEERMEGWLRDRIILEKSHSENLRVEMDRFGMKIPQKITEDVEEDSESSRLATELCKQLDEKNDTAVYLCKEIDRLRDELCTAREESKTSTQLLSNVKLQLAEREEQLEKVLREFRKSSEENSRNVRQIHEAHRRHQEEMERKLVEISSKMDGKTEELRNIISENIRVQDHLSTLQQQLTESRESHAATLRIVEEQRERAKAVELRSESEKEDLVMNIRRAHTITVEVEKKASDMESRLSSQISDVTRQLTTKEEREDEREKILNELKDELIELRNHRENPLDSFRMPLTIGAVVMSATAIALLVRRR
ncbi:hypothetical protein PROFUN_09521, partial [Planoprotostelium fungivorum]